MPVSRVAWESTLLEEVAVAEDIWPTIHAERQALADDLADLPEAQWQTPSLCSGWTVHQVLAHLLSAAKMTPAKFFVNFAAAGFRFNAYTSKQVAREAAGGPAATLAEFRAVRDRTSAPPGPKETWLGEAFVHGEDIRRPLGIAHSYPTEEVVRVIRFYARSNTIIGGKDRISGLTLRATDTDFSIGSGPLVDGPAVALMLAATGRRSALLQLTGPGVEVLQGRLAASTGTG
jgi:uncharacterized protein (TIGR03083 family)